MHAMEAVMGERRRRAGGLALWARRAVALLWKLVLTCTGTGLFALARMAL